MAQEDLILITTTERAKELGSRGGKVISPAKKLAARLREWKKRLGDGRLKDTDLEWIATLATDPAAMSLDLISTIESIKESPYYKDDIEMKAKVATLTTNAMKTIHGEKLKIHSTNVNIEVKQEAEKGIDDFIKNITDEVNNSI